MNLIKYYLIQLPISSFYYAKRYIQNIWRYKTAVGCQFDDEFDNISEILEIKFKLLYDAFKEWDDYFESNTKEATKDTRQIRLCLRLVKRINSDWYEKRIDAAHSDFTNKLAFDGVAAADYYDRVWEIQQRDSRILFKLIEQNFYRWWH